jgi:hypothetical protein
MILEEMMLKHNSSKINFKCFQIAFVLYVGVHGESQVLFVLLIVPVNSYIRSQYNNKCNTKKICMYLYYEFGMKMTMTAFIFKEVHYRSH